MTDLSHWLTVEQATAQLGVSERTLYRMRDKGEIQAQKWKGRVVFDPEAVQGRKPSPPTQVVAPTKSVGSANGLPALPPVADMAELPELTLPMLVEVIRGVLQPTAAPAAPLWCKLQEASEVTGLSPAFLERMVKDGQLVGVKDRSVKVRRADLETLDVSGVAIYGKGRKRK